MLVVGCVDHRGFAPQAAAPNRVYRNARLRSQSESAPGTTRTASPREADPRTMRKVGPAVRHLPLGHVARPIILGDEVSVQYRGKNSAARTGRHPPGALSRIRAPTPTRVAPQPLRAPTSPPEAHRPADPPCRRRRRRPTRRSSSACAYVEARPPIPADPIGAHVLSAAVGRLLLYVHPLILRHALQTSLPRRGTETAAVLGRAQPREPAVGRPRPHIVT